MRGRYMYNFIALHAIIVTLMSFSLYVFGAIRLTYMYACMYIYVCTFHLLSRASLPRKYSEIAIRGISYSHVTDNKDTGLVDSELNTCAVISIVVRYATRGSH